MPKEQDLSHFSKDDAEASRTNQIETLLHQNFSPHTFAEVLALMVAEWQEMIQNKEKLPDNATYFGIPRFTVRKDSPFRQVNTMDLSLYGSLGILHSSFVRLQRGDLSSEEVQFEKRALSFNAESLVRLFELDSPRYQQLSSFHFPQLKEWAQRMIEIVESEDSLREYFPQNPVTEEKSNFVELFVGKYILGRADIDD
jgi:hypothetical protein